MVINHNIQSIGITRNLKINHTEKDRIYTYLSSAMKINKAGDDASGLAVSEKMRTQVRGLNRAALNTQDGISLLQTADGYLSDSTDIIQRIREIAVAGANGIYTSEDRMQLQVEVSQLVDELDRITSHAQFNAVNLFTGRYAHLHENSEVYAGSMWFHIGANMDQRERVFLNTMSAKALGLKDVITDKLIQLSTINSANSAIGTIDLALSRISSQRASIGASQNQLEFWTKGIMQSSENIQHAESRVRDADMAKESVDYIKNNVLIDTSASLLSRSHSIQRDVVNKMVLKYS